MIERLSRLLADDSPCLLTAVGFMAILLHLALIPLPRADNHLLSSDGAYYYLILRSIVLDGDLRLENDVAANNSRLATDDPSRIEIVHGTLLVVP